MESHFQVMEVSREQLLMWQREDPILTQVQTSVKLQGGDERWPTI